MYTREGLATNNRIKNVALIFEAQPRSEYDRHALGFERVEFLDITNRGPRSGPILNSSRF